MLLKITNNECPLTIPSYYLQMERATRNHHPKGYILPTSYTNIYQQGVYYRTIRDWNALPPRIFYFDDIGKFTDEIQNIYI